uniref:NADH-ubiquinone oxidoreductase chain 6 n=1 Tax=Electrophorus electricus TaxID=8005 RepID=F7UIA0_ELEEL|nr:NADH dehydrogenase subunit 6 [Electrophorus electricus]
MTYIFFFSFIGLVGGMAVVASNPAPYFAALGMVVAAGGGCGVLVNCGGSFLSLVLFLIYLGGMLVVFAYSAALAAEPYPKSLGDYSVFGYVLLYVVGVVVVWLGVGWCGWYDGCLDLGGDGFFVLRGDFVGVAMMYFLGGWMLIICAWVLLLTLFVVLEVTRGFNRGCLRII